MKHETARFRAGGLSDRGRVRPENEDAFAVLPGASLAVVADGMGGHASGATAAAVVVKVVPKAWAERLTTFPGMRSQETTVAMRDTITHVSQDLCNKAAGLLGLADMGSTVVLLFLRRGLAYVAHMGDSRAYLLRDGEMRLLTEDHSVVALLLRAGEIRAEEAPLHPSRGQLSRYVGMRGKVYPDVLRMRTKRGDRFLLCTDGLTGMVSDDDISAVLGQGMDPHATSERLVALANEAGGRDNITAVVVDWGAV